MEAFGGFLLIEPTTRYFQSFFVVKKIYAYEKSEYQEIALVELEGFGRALVIDNLIQSTEKDEHIYHESLVHPALALHPNPRRVLVLGGGEGATLREVLKHNTVREAVMVDIDRVVIEFAKKYLEFMHQGSFNDERVKVVIMDGLKYVKESESGVFDVVIMDLTDPYASGIARPLYSVESFKEIYRILREDGVVVTQAGNSFFYNKSYDYVYSSVKKVFPIVSEYWVWVPSFAYTCNFVLASKRYLPEDLSSREFDQRLKERGVETKYINGRRFRSFIDHGIITGDLEE